MTAFTSLPMANLSSPSDVVCDKKHFAELDLITGIARDTGDVQSLVFLDFELLTGYFHYC